MTSRPPLFRMSIAVAGLALITAGCSSGGGQTAVQGQLHTITETTTVYMSSPPVQGSEVTPSSPPGQTSSVQNASVGTPFAVTCHHSRPCDGQLTITSLTVGEPCEFGVNTYFGTERQESFKKKPGESYLQLHAEFALTSAGGGWMMVDDPEVIDADGFTQTPGPNVECLESADGEGDWGSTIDAGQKQRLYDSWVIPDGATAIILEGHRIALSF